MNIKRLFDVTNIAFTRVVAIVVSPYAAFPLAFVVGFHVFDADATFVGRISPVADVVEPALKVVAVPFLNIIHVFIPDMFAALPRLHMSYLAPLPVIIGLAPDLQVVALLDG